MNIADLTARNEAAIRHAAELIDMPLVCAWCGTYIRPPLTQNPAAVSHGICPECLEREKAKLLNKPIPGAL